MRTLFSLIVVAVSGILGIAAQTAAPAPRGYKLTVQVQGVNNEGGDIGVLVFNSEKGWPEDRTIALRAIAVDAHPGTVKVEVPSLPAGDYAVALVHDVNKNHKLDRNWLGIPTEQWGLSNNPHPTFRTPSFEKAKFPVNGDTTIVVRMQCKWGVPCEEKNNEIACSAGGRWPALPDGSHTRDRA